MKSFWPHMLVALGSSTLLASCGHSAAPTPRTAAAPTETAAPAKAASVSAKERELYDIVMRLARDPALIPRLAPDARDVFHGETEVDEPLASSPDALRWIADANVLLVASGAPVPEEVEVTMECLPAELRCVISQPGGETFLTFSHRGEGADRRIVLSKIEGSEP